MQYKYKYQEFFRVFVKYLETLYQRTNPILCHSFKQKINKINRLYYINVVILSCLYLKKFVCLYICRVLAFILEKIGYKKRYKKRYYWPIIKWSFSFLKFILFVKSVNLVMLFWNQLKKSCNNACIKANCKTRCTLYNVFVILISKF